MIKIAEAIEPQLSPEYYSAYEKKRQVILDSTHLVELDLLRGGKPMARVYDRVRYASRIDYRSPVPPPTLPEEDQQWVEALLSQ